MLDLNDKATGGSLTAAEWNQLPSEVQNVIESTGQTLSGNDVKQLAKAIAMYAANGQYYSDEGEANSYVLVPTGNRVSPPMYQDGGTFEFIAANPNTGACTVAVGGLSAKNIKLPDGSDPVTGQISARVILKYNASADRMELANDSFGLESRVKSNEEAIAALQSVVQGLSEAVQQNTLAIESLDSSAFPVGGIGMWDGAISNIPSGWALCNGANGTPNLRDKFIVGAGGAYNVGTSGGAINKTSSAAGLHNHNGSTGNTALTVAQMPSHDHKFKLTTWVGGDDATGSFPGKLMTADRNLSFADKYPDGVSIESKGSGQGHNHSVGNDGTHTHVTDVRPPYYALAFIKKTG